MDKKIVKNFIFSAVYQVLLAILPLITAPYVARVLQPEGNGIYSYTSSIAMVFALFAALGFATYGQREIAYHQDDIRARSVTFFEIVIFRGITTLAATLAFVVFSLIYRKYTVYLLPQVVTVIAVMFDVSWYYQGLENFRITVTRNCVIKVLSVTCIFLFVKQPEHLGRYIAIMSLSTFLSNAIYLFNLKRHVARVDWKALKPLRHLRGTVEFFIPLIAVQIYSHLDRIMLGYLTPTAVQGGYYEQARKITTIVVGLIVSINSVMLPRISKLYARRDTDQIIGFYRQTFRVLLLMLLPLTTGIFLIADEFVLWFFGAEYAGVAPLMKLSAPLVVFMCVGNFVGIQYLSPMGQQNKMTRAYIVAALSNIALNALLIPRFAAVGAMAASVIAEFVSCGLQLWLLLKSEYRFNLLSGAWKYALATLGMVAIILVNHSLLNLRGIMQTLVDISTGAVVYGAILLLEREENVTAILRKVTHRA